MCPFSILSHFLLFRPFLYSIFHEKLLFLTLSPVIHVMSLNRCQTASQSRGASASFSETLFYPGKIRRETL